MAPKKVVKREKVSNNPEQDKAIQKQKYSLFLCNHLLLSSALIGCALALYSYGVEKSIEKDENHQAYCDISDRISCTKVFRSPYGKGLGIFQEGTILYEPNSFFAIVYYTIICVFAFINSPVAVYGSFSLIIAANIISPYFAYILFFILNDLCIVCIGIYLINGITLFTITKKYNIVMVLKELERQKTPKLPKLKKHN